jgi:23S rRNA (uracil1939-C5)-methyltransferase
MSDEAPQLDFPLSPSAEKTHVIRIEQVGQRGEGVGRSLGGDVFFVYGAVPGDRVRVAAPPGKRYREARLVEVLEPSPDRVTPPCPYFERCGGCDWLHWGYEAQLRGKEGIVRRMLERAQLPVEALRPIVPAKTVLGYRSRVQVRREGASTGFYERRSHAIVDVERCAVALPEINAALAALRREPAPPGRTKVELFRRDDGSVGRAVNLPHAAMGFTQIHREQNELLRQTVAAQVRAAGARKVLELFCGDGNLTFAYFPAVDRIVAIDVSEPALEAARTTREKVEPVPPFRITFLTSAIGPRTLGKTPPDFRNAYDTLVLDPPRVGIGTTLSAFLQRNLRSLIYVACSPTAFSVDVQLLRKEFRLMEIVPIDMFPQTHHVELVARFERVSAR